MADFYYEGTQNQITSNKPVRSSFDYINRVYRPNPSPGKGGKWRHNGGGWRQSANMQNGDYNNRWKKQTGLSENWFRKVISVPSQKINRIIGKGGSKIRDLEYKSNAKIRIEDSHSMETYVQLIGADSAIMKAEKLIQSLLEDYKPAEHKRFNHNTTITASSESLKHNHASIQIIDWLKLNTYYHRHQQERWRKLLPIIKDFYKEDPEVTAMSPAMVKFWRITNHDIQVKRIFDDELRLRPLPNPIITFEHAFKHYPNILNSIYKQGFQKPSPIQSQAWPILLRGDDLIGIAQTGTGKTLAFLLPALIHIDGQTIPRDQRKGPTVLIMAPTRELALQINKEVNKYLYKGITSVCVYGGGDRRKQIMIVANGVDIVIATPGRFNDLVLSGHLNVINFSYVVLVEADRMLDMRLEPQIRKSLFNVRRDRQTIMTSATWPPRVRCLANSYMKDPIQVNVGSLDVATIHSVAQNFIFIEEIDKEPTLYKFIMNLNPKDKVIIFCKKKAMTTHIMIELCMKGIKCQFLHGDRYQSDREQALADIINGTVNILIATDVASRGIDIRDLTYVVNFDFPHNIEEYVHRIGRTGRAGCMGIALTFISRNDGAHASELIKILQEANQDVPEELEHMAERFEARKWRRNQRHVRTKW